MTEVKYNIDFWKSFDRNIVPVENSAFAEFCLQYMKTKSSVLDICNGNGRDTQLFKKRELRVTAFDYETLNLEDKISKFGLEEMFDNVYCRFVLHAIPEHLEDYVLINANNVLNKGGLFYIEARSDKGKIHINNHYRRLINIDIVKSKLKRLNFEIVFESETDGLSVYNNEDPVLIRIIAKKKNDIETRGTVRDEKKTYCIINPVNSYYVLTTVKQIFEDNNIPFFLVFGTLLGAYRDKAFIKHDTDIDLGLLEEYKEKVMQLINDGYFAIRGLLYIREWHKKEHLVALQYKTEYVDFWFFKKKDKKYVSGRFYNMLIFQIDKGLSDIEFYGQTFKTVNNIEKYLDRHYKNSDWRLSVEDYHAKF